MISRILKSVFGSRNDRLVKQYTRKVAAINALEPLMATLPDADLIAKTAAFKARVAGGESLDDILPEGSNTYYRETNHSHDYVVEKWGKWFDVLGIFVGAHFDYQDFCVLRRRAALPVAPSVLM